jgi:hypothetical protein
MTLSAYFLTDHHMNDCWDLQQHLCDHEHVFSYTGLQESCYKAAMFRSLIVICTICCYDSIFAQEYIYVWYDTQTNRDFRRFSQFWDCENRLLASPCLYVRLSVNMEKLGSHLNFHEMSCSSIFQISRLFKILRE